MVDRPPVDVTPAVNRPDLKQFWLWTATDPLTGKRRQLRYRMTEATARERFGEDARKVEGSLEERPPHGSTNFLGELKKP